MKWPVVKLGDVCRVTPGFAFKSEAFQTEGIPVVKIANIQGDYTVDLSDAQCWPQELFSERHQKFVLKDKDILLAMTGATAGKLGRVRTTQDLLLNQRVAKIEATSAEPDFIWFALSSEKYRERFYSIAGGAAQPNMSGGQIEAVEILLPPPLAQNRIADVLSAYDDLMENNRRRMALLEESARLLYREWFVRLRFPGHEHIPLTNGVPQGWERVPFECALVLQRGFDLPEREWQEGEFPICCSTGIVGYHNEAKAKGPGVFTGRSGSLGVVNYVESDYWPHNTALWVRDFIKVTPLFALFLLREMNLDQYNGGASVPTLDRKAVHRVPVLVPPRKFITLFDEQLTPMFEQLRNLRQQHQKLRAARDLLLPRLMSGEVAV